MQNVCHCHGLLARPILSWSYLFYSLLYPFPSFSSFPFFIAPNLKMARYEMLAVSIPKLQRDLSSAETEALLCSCWRGSGCFHSGSKLQSFSSLQPLSAPSGCCRDFCVCFPQGCKQSKTAVSAVVCREVSFYMNEWVSAFQSFSLSPEGALGLVFCQPRVSLS